MPTSNNRKLLIAVLLVPWMLLGCDEISFKPGKDSGRPAVGPGPVSTIGLELVAESFTAPVALRDDPNRTGRLFIVDQSGVVRIIRGKEVLAEPFLDVRASMVQLMPNFDERGLLGLAFHPDYRNNGRLFVYYSAPLRPGAPADFNCTARLSEFKVLADDPDRVDPKSERILLEVDKPQFNHNGGTLAFGPDGYLFMSLGDGGGANDVGPGHGPNGNGQDTNILLGKILRIDVDGAQPYGIPRDNPFVSGGGLPEIYAWGFRNPYRFSFDLGGEQSLYVGDVGQDLYEEVDLVTRGGNYGWNTREGFHCFDKANPGTPLASCPETGPKGEPLLPPLLEYGNTGGVRGGQGLAVVGGFIYRGTRMPELVGRYIFGDFSSSFTAARGSVFIAGRSANEREPWQMRELGVAQRLGGALNAYLTGIGQDRRGEVYLLTSQMAGPNGTTGRVYRMVDEALGEADPVPPPPPPPANDTVEGQAARGQALYAQNCASCHGEAGEGGKLAPALVGPEALPQTPPADRQFRKMEFRTAADVYGFASKYMPADAPASLPPHQYVDILSFALKANGLMLKEPLSLENASQVVIHPQPASR